MRVLLFEFISGGGFAQGLLPEALLLEGCMMRNALLDDLSLLPDIELIVLRDERVKDHTAVHNTPIQYCTIYPETDIQVLLTEMQSSYDIVWLIAPETESILAQWCLFFSQQGKQIASSGYQAVILCQDKMATLSVLQDAQIPIVPGELYSVGSTPNKLKSIVKVNNSVGCDEVFLLETEQHWHEIVPKLSVDRQYMIQPYVVGKVYSLSCVFNHGEACFICCNEQHMQVTGQQFKLLACTVNVQSEMAYVYQALCQQVAQAIPSLFGYAGVDFIQTEQGDNLILEINPRLSSSYAGISKALGVNIARLVLGMLHNQQPMLEKKTNKSVYLDLQQGLIHAN